MFKKLSFSTLGAAFILFALSTVAFAADSELPIAALKYFTVSVFAAGFGIAVAAWPSRTRLKALQETQNPRVR